MVLQQIKKWFEHGVPNVTKRAFLTQTGVHFEEVAEMTDEMVGDDPESAARIEELNRVLRAFATDMKNGEISYSIRDAVAFLDAGTDQIVTITGVHHMANQDIIGGAGETADSNDSKFEEDGTVLRDPNGKIMKSKRYRKPDLARFAVETRFLAEATE